jgi:membrane fusion protein, multidrug efflux system
MKIKRIIGWLTIIAIIAILVLYKIFTTSGDASTSRKSGAAGAVNVKAVIVKTDKFEHSLTVVGSMAANEYVELKSEISGKITSINFKEGSNVAAGALLVKINDSELMAQLKKAMTQRSLAVEQEQRQRLLLEKSGTSQESYDKAKNELESIDADIELLKAQIEKTEIRAPFSGTIGFRSVSLGSYVSPSQVIAVFYSISPIKIEFDVPQKYFELIKPGETISFKIPNSENSYQAVIYACQPEIDPTTRTLKVRALYTNKNRDLLPGAYVECTLNFDIADETVMIPSEALTADIFSDKVYLFKGGKAVEQKVVTGERTEDKIQIQSGISTGDTLIVSGIIQLKQNLPVSIEIIDSVSYGKVQ